MDTQPAFGFNELLTFIVGDMAQAICERNGETKQQQFNRSQAAVAMILSFQPRDVIEAMLAGHCVMFHAVMTDSTRDTLRGEVDTMRHGTRSNLVALNKAFTGNLDRLERYRMRPSEGQRDAVEVSAKTPIAEPTPRSPARSPRPAVQVPTQPAIAVIVPETPAVQGPSVRSRAAFNANPEVAAALAAGDPLRFARAMGIEPSADFLAAAAAPGSPFDIRAAGPWPAGNGSGTPKA